MNLKQPVCIILPGYSTEVRYREISTLLFQTGKFLTAGLNRFEILEKRFGIHFDITLVTSIKGYAEQAVHIRRFLEREKDNLYITNKRCLEFAKTIIEDPSFLIQGVHSGRVLVTDIGFNNQIWYNSITALLLILNWLDVPEIYVFGCDGFAVSQGKVYAFQEDVYEEWEEYGNRKKCIEKDTRIMNECFDSTFDEFKVKRTSKIYNVTSEGCPTAVKCLPQMDINEVMERLK